MNRCVDCDEYVPYNIRFPHHICNDCIWYFTCDHESKKEETEIDYFDTLDVTKFKK